MEIFQVCQPGAAVAGQDRVHGRGGQAEAERDPGRAHRRVTRSFTILRSVRLGVRAGLACGRDERSAIPADPACR
jgi:hypothetical protein